MGDPVGDAEEGSERAITHGICDQCVDNIRFQQGADVQDILDSLDTPVLVIDADDRIEMLNQKARDRLNITSDRFKGKKRGQVFECQYARSPEGCGRSVHCSGCAMRRAILDTLETGRCHSRDAAPLKYEDSETKFTISTEKAGDAVLLRIDEIGVQQEAQPSPEADK
jgi:transcriptional regulator with PAS, ATPase and Fis domain